MKRSKIILLGVLISVVLFFVLTPNRKINRYKIKSTKAVAEELEVSPGLANFLINTKVGRKTSYAFIRKKVFETQNTEDE